MTKDCPVTIENLADGSIGVLVAFGDAVAVSEAEIDARVAFHYTDEGEVCAMEVSVRTLPEGEA